MSDKVRINNQETPILQKLAADVPDKGLILEIGACWGYSASKMAGASKNSVRIITIDPWTLSKNKQQPAREKLFYETIEPFKDKITPIKAFSWSLDLEALEIIFGELNIDLLFIDGDHSFDGVKKDYEKYGGLVKRGGLIVFHDYGYWDGVTRAIDELVAPSGLWQHYTVHRFWIGKRV